MSQEHRIDAADRRLARGMYAFCGVMSVLLAGLGIWVLLIQHDPGPGIIALAGAAALAGGLLVEHGTRLGRPA